MTTSGSTDYNRTGTQIITFAHKLLQLIPSGGTVGTNEAADGLESLELMVKSWQAEGIKLWIETEARVFTVKDQASYDLPGANGCKITELSETTLDADEASGQTVLSVASTSQGAGFADSDTIGIVLDGGTIQWTTIASFVTDDTVTVSDALTGSASSGNKVFAYTTAIKRPLQILSARRLQDNVEIQLWPWARSEYFNQPNKDTSSTVTQYYYDPQLTTGKLYVWPRPDTVDQMLNFTYKRTIEDFDLGSNDPDFPQEWLEALGYNLAIRIAPQFGKTLVPEIATMALVLKDMVEGFSVEEVSVHFSGGGRTGGMF